VTGVLIGGVSQAMLGLYQFVNQIGPDWFIILGRFMRASGTFRQPNPYAGYLGLLLPVAVSLAIWSWAALLRGSEPNDSPVRRLHPVDQWVKWGMRIAGPLFFSGAALAIVAGLLASWSRGGWLGMLAGVGVVIVFRSRLAALLSGLALLLLLTGLLLGSFRPDAVPEPVMARMQEIPAFLGMTDILSQPVTDENFAVIERLAHWVAAIRMWEMAPWFGVGPGNYATVYPLVRLPRWEDALGHAHNVYLNVLGETGLVGLTAYLALWIGVVVWLWRRFRRFPHGSYAGALALGVLGSIAHLSVHNGFDNLYVQGIYILVALLLAAVAGEGKLKIED
jgi:O-antigen ligase